MMRTSIPLYHHLKMSLLNQMETGKLERGSLIPSEPELAKQYNVSRTTVRQAISDLVSSGYLTRQQGRGTFVADRKDTKVETELYGFAEELRQKGKSVQIQVNDISVMPCPKKVSGHLNIEPLQPVIHISRTAYIDEGDTVERSFAGSPIFHESSYFALPPYLLEKENDLRPEILESVYGWFERTGIKIGLGKQTIRAGKATSKEVEFLKANLDDPVLIVTRITQDVTGTPVEYSEVAYAHESYEFEINLHRNER